MEINACKGQLERWNDDKGFGFVRPENSAKEIFIHISALKKMSRRPVVGDVIIYNVHTDNAGKSRAINAVIQGVLPIKPRSAKKNGKPSRIPMLILLVMVISIVVYAGFGKNSGVFRSDEIEPTLNTRDSRASYSCDGRIYCSQMTSCEEAMFYQQYCPDAKMDGDGDGVPCETQWCGR